ncbi:MAG: pectate lyase precursor [Actinobacteria bacterium]|nr:pectate lyase precursor [Actinomycetota bacterium]
MTRALVALAVAALIAAVGAAPGAAQPAEVPAFPGAEGFGAMVTGGRGGDVYVVTTLEGFGEGSFGDALDPASCAPRIVVFAVSGVIEGDFDLTCGDITIAGQTAPGAGVTIRGRIDAYGASPAGNIIMRHIRVRPGPAEPENAHFHDAIQLSNNPGVILDHVSASWGTDEAVDLFEGSGDITIQWSTVEESRAEGHPDGPHNKGMIVGPGVERVSIHHVLFAHHRDRCPAVASGPAEVINVVAYDCKDSFVHHNPADGEFHLRSNVYRRGPSVETGLFVPIFFDDEEPGDTAYYVAGNLIDDPGVVEGVVDDIWAQPYAHPNLEFAGGQQYRIDEPTNFSADSPDHVTVTVDDAQAAYEAVLAQAGAFPRDGVTARTIQEVRDRGGSWGASEPDDLLAGLDPAEAPTDADADGMADAWEVEQGLDPGDGEDHATVMASGYTAVEEYINEVADELVLSAPSADPAAGGDGGAGAGAPEPAGDEPVDDQDDVAGQPGATAPADRPGAAQVQPQAASSTWLLAVAALGVSMLAAVLSAFALGLAVRGRRDRHSSGAP